MAVPAEPNAEAWANLIQDQGQGQPLVQANKFRLKNSNLKPKHNHLKRLRAPRRPKFKLASLHVYRVLCQVLPFMCHPFTVVPRSHILLPYLPDKKLGRVFDLRKSLVVRST